MTTAATKTGEHVGKKAGDKIVKMLSKDNTKSNPKNVSFNNNDEIIPSQKRNKAMTKQEINKRVNQILSGGSMRKRKII